MGLKTFIASLGTIVMLSVSAQASTIFLAGDSNIFEQGANGDNEVFFQNVFNGKSVVNFSGRSLANEGTTATENFQGAGTTITSSALAGQDFLIFGWDRTGVSTAEIAAIDAFHDAGGSLFLFGEGAPGFNPLNNAVNSILSAVGSTMSISLNGSDNLVAGGFSTFAVTGATDFAAGVNTWRSAFASGINLGSGTAVISGNGGSGFGTAVAVEFADAPPVPLPGGLPLIATGLALFGVMRRYRKA